MIKDFLYCYFKISEYNITMKTNLEGLKKRGYLTKEDSDLVKNYSYPELLKLLNDKEAFKRTAAISRLRNIVDINELDKKILEILVHEKALYTRLEILDVLASGNATTIKRMIPYINKIGKNQHHIIPNQVSKKESYPLPRDIIVRTLARMDPKYFNEILKILNCDDKIVGQVIDAIGWQVFYHQELATDNNYQVIVEMVNKYHDNEFIMWKLIICMSAFNQAEELLKQLASRNAIIDCEIKRSLSLIAKRKN